MKNVEEIEKAFETWWNNEVRGMPPLRKEDAEAHVHRISRIAWLNGADTAFEMARAILKEP